MCWSSSSWGCISWTPSFFRSSRTCCLSRDSKQLSRSGSTTLTSLYRAVRAPWNIQWKKGQKNRVSNIPNCNLAYSLGNGTLVCKSANCHTFVFLQVLLFFSINYDCTHRLRLESLLWFLFRASIKMRVSPNSTDPLSCLRDLPHWPLHYWIFQITLWRSQLSLLRYHTHLCPLHFIPGAYSQVWATHTLGDLKNLPVSPVVCSSKRDCSWIDIVIIFF